MFSSRKGNTTSVSSQRSSFLGRVEAIGIKKPESATLSEALREILKFFSDDGENRRTLLDVAEIYRPNAYVGRDYHSQLTCARTRIRVYFTHDVVVTTFLKSLICFGTEVVFRTYSTFLQGLPEIKSLTNAKAIVVHDTVYLFQSLVGLSCSGPSGQAPTTRKSYVNVGSRTLREGRCKQQRPSGFPEYQSWAYWLEAHVGAYRRGR